MSTLKSINYFSFISTDFYKSLNINDKKSINSFIYYLFIKYSNIFTDCIFEVLDLYTHTGKHYKGKDLFNKTVKEFIFACEYAKKIPENKRDISKTVSKSYISAKPLFSNLFNELHKIHKKKRKSELIINVKNNKTEICFKNETNSKNIITINTSVDSVTNVWFYILYFIFDFNIFENNTKKYNIPELYGNEFKTTSYITTINKLKIFENVKINNDYIILDMTNREFCVLLFIQLFKKNKFKKYQILVLSKNIISSENNIATSNNIYLHLFNKKKTNKQTNNEIRKLINF